MCHYSDCFEMDDIEFNLCYFTGKDNMSESKNSPSHFHQYIEFLFTGTEGYFEVETEDGTLTVNEGELCIIPTLAVHSTKFHVDPISMYGIMFFMKRRKGISSERFYRMENMFKNHKIHKIKLNDACRNYFKELQNEIKFPSKESVLKIRYLFSLITLSVSEMSDVEYHVPSGDEIKADDRMIIIEEYIHNNYMNNITLSDLAKEVHMCERQVNRILKSHTGYSFKDILLQQRMWTAKELLGNETVNIADIAKMTGFTSYSGFYSSVKNFWGMTPYELRKSII